MSEKCKRPYCADYTVFTFFFQVSCQSFPSQHPAGSLPLSFHDFQTLHLSLINPVRFPDLTAQKLSGGVVFHLIFQGACTVLIRVAVKAAVRTGMIGADIHAFHAAAALPLSLIRLQLQPAAAGLLQQPSVNAAAPFDAAAGQVPALAAGLYPQAVLRQSFQALQRERKSLSLRFPETPLPSASHTDPQS